MVHEILQSAGLLMLAIAAWLIIRLLFSNLKTRKLRPSDNSTFDEKIHQAKEKHATHQKLSDGTWEGFRPFVVVEKIDEGGGIFSYYLKPADGKTFPAFLPGQYLTFSFEMPEHNKPVVRCYSLSDTPYQSDYYRVSIKRILPTHAQPDLMPGLISNYFYEHISEGDTVNIKAPRGSFCLDIYDKKPIVMIAGGIGITPLLSMLNTINAASSDRTVHFIYAVMNGAEHIMKEHLAAIAARHANVHLHVFYAEISADDELGVDYHHEGFVCLEKLKAILPSNNVTFFLCGPPPMLKILFQDLLSWGVPKDNIRYEAFGPAIIKELNAAVCDDGVQHDINYQLTNYTAQWEANEGTLLEFSHAHGIDLRYGCRAGRCGVCMLKVKGKVDYITTPQVDIPQGNCLPCIAIPLESIDVEA